MILFDNHYSKMAKFSQEKVRVDFAHRYHQADNEHQYPPQAPLKILSFSKNESKDVDKSPQSKINPGI